MFHRRLNAVLLAVVAYLLSAWFFTFIAFCVASSAGRDWKAILLAAPAAVPMLLVQTRDPFLADVVIWFICILGGTVVFFRVLRRWLMPVPPQAKSRSGTIPGK
jgi:hypothetical protein